MIEGIIGPVELQFLVAMAFALLLGFLIGAEREARGKDAGISTHVLVIAGAALFTQISAIVDPMSTSRIAAQIVSGIGFLGAGLILKEGASVKNLTTAASLWVAGAIGMAIGFGFYVLAVIAAVVSILAPRIPHFHRRSAAE
ncbi:MAG TPA: MgtC/SapB family protein [Candidatus Paceibacterota bacterium]|nr:MgtC/SapB family protein [Candidatus Paceibacterota bacterium]